MNWRNPAVETWGGLRANRHPHSGYSPPATRTRTAASRSGLASCRGVRVEPDIGQQLVEPPRGMGRQAAEEVLEVGEGVDVVVLAGACQGVEYGRRGRSRGRWRTRWRPGRGWS